MERGDVVAGRYRLTERLAMGRQSEVWRAQDHKDVAVAVRLLRASSDERGRVEAFHHRSELIDRVRTSGVVSILAAGHQDGVTYRVTQLLDGAPLEEASRGQRLTQGWILSLALRVGEALHDAHRLGLFHGHIDPWNIWMDSQGLPWLLDFESSLGNGAHAAEVSADLYGLGMTTLYLLNQRALPQQASRNAAVSVNALKLSKPIKVALLGAVVPEQQQRFANLQLFCQALRGALPPPPPPLEAALPAGVTLKWAEIPAGRFLMGSPASEVGRHDDEGPQHEVVLTQPLWLATTPVTQAQWSAIMEENPSNFKGDDQRPVENVSWYDAVSFCNRLSEQLKLRQAYYADEKFKRPFTGKEGEVHWDKSAPGVRLPTEAEWEYACRAGTTSAFNSGAELVGDGGEPSRKGRLSDGSSLEELAWFDQNSQSSTQPVGQKKSNAWGLYDMHGNVWEWCWDRWSGDYEGRASPAEDPPGPTRGDRRVYRGGSWDYGARVCRSALRSRGGPVVRFNGLGFRVARRPPPAEPGL